MRNSQTRLATAQYHGGRCFSFDMLLCCVAAEFTSELCAETWVVKDGTVTPLLKGVRIEGAGEQVCFQRPASRCCLAHSMWLSSCTDGMHQMIGGSTAALYVQVSEEMQEKLAEALKEKAKVSLAGCTLVQLVLTGALSAMPTTA